MSEYRKCPYCGEEILAKAKKCKHCREWLTDQPANALNKKMETTTTNGEKVVVENMPNQDSQPVVTNQQQPIVNVYTTTAQMREPKQRNGIGLTGFILSLVCLFTSWAPGLNLVMWILGLVFSAVGVFRKPKGFAIAGLIISMISILIIILLAAVIGELGSELFKELGI